MNQRKILPFSDITILLLANDEFAFTQNM